MLLGSLHLNSKDKIDTFNDNQDVVLLPPMLFIKAINIALTNKIAHLSPSNLLVSATLHTLDDWEITPHQSI